MIRKVFSVSPVLSRVLVLTVLGVEFVWHLVHGASVSTIALGRLKATWHRTTEHIQVVFADDNVFYFFV